MATVTGERGTGNIAADQRKIDMADTVSLLEPESNPITLLSKRAGKKRAINPVIKWLEKSPEPRFDAVNNGAGYASGDTSIVVDNGAYFAEHFLVLVTRTGELLRVTAVSTNTLTVVRAVGSTAAAIVDNDEIYILSTAQPEGDTSRPARSSNPSTVTNYLQIFRDSWDLTETLRHSDMVTTEHDWDLEAKEKGIEHAKSIELALLLGKASENTSGSQPRRSTKGALQFIATNQTDAGGALSETEFQTFQRSIGRYGSRRRVFFTSGLVAGTLNAFATGRLETRQGDSTYGLDVMTYISPFGKLDVLVHWLLDGAKYGGYGVALDMGEIKYRFLANEQGSRDTHIKTNIQENDRDGRKDEYKSEVGLQFGQERRHGLLSGVTG